MTGVEEVDAVQLPLESAGQILRRAREEKGLSLKDIADKTRISLHHLEAIEAGAFSRLPGRTYALGFSRTYARAMELDENAIMGTVRAELAECEERNASHSGGFEPGDPAKLPPRGLVWVVGIAALFLFVASMVFITRNSGIGTGPDPLVVDEPAVQAQIPTERSAQTTPTPATTAGQVVFTALEDGVWVRFYDATGARLLEKQMAHGERFAVPQDIEAPQIWTGRPDAFAITIGGKPVPKLAEDDIVMRDVAISARALLARNDAGMAANGGTGAAIN
ncbi:MAG: hypothetical protein APF82_04350 [Sphingomonadales bacterium BRH_c42]|nr:MAG: hypothetical protein APF82_04350 [Sphingomonadales bacterium BRH_c42]